MKRKFSLVGVIMLLLMVALVNTASADLPGSGWWTAFSAMNLDESANATVMAQAYHMTGGEDTVYDFTDTVPPGGNKTFHPGACADGSTLVFPCLEDDDGDPLPAGFMGSAVLSADMELAAVVQVGNNEQAGVGVSGGTAAALYNGKASGTESVFYPTVKHNYGAKTTTFFIQAAGGDATVSATYVMNDGSTYTDNNHAIEANRSYLFDPSAAGVPSTACDEANPESSQCLGAVTFEAQSGQSIVGTVVEHRHTASPAKTAQSTALLTESDDASTLYCPLYKNAYPPGASPRTTGISIQNVGSADTNVTVTAIIVEAGSNTTPAGTEYSETFTGLGPGESHVWYPATDNIEDLPSGHYATVTVEASDGQTIVGNVNESNLAGTIRQTIYSCFAAPNTTSVAVAPSFKEDFGGSIDTTNRSGLTVQNVGDANTTVSATFVCSDSNDYTPGDETLDAGEGYTYYLPSAVPDGIFCAVTLESTGEPIVALVQEAPTPGTPTDIDNKNYEGFNITP